MTNIKKSWCVFRPVCVQACVCAGRQHELAADAALPEPSQARATVAHTNSSNNKGLHRHTLTGRSHTLANNHAACPYTSTTAAAATVPGAYLVDGAVPQPGAAPVHRLIGSLHGTHRRTHSGEGWHEHLDDVTSEADHQAALLSPAANKHCRQATVLLCCEHC